jgi:hypothetical protein
MMSEPQKEFQEFVMSLAKLRAHLAGDPEAVVLMQDAMNKLCRYYNSDTVARAGRHVIQNILAQHPHLHFTETSIENWGFEFVVTCDNCGQEEAHRVVKSAVDVGAALNRHRVI